MSENRYQGPGWLPIPARQSVRGSRLLQIVAKCEYDEKGEQRSCLTQLTERRDGGLSRYEDPYGERRAEIVS